MYSGNYRDLIFQDAEKVTKASRLQFTRFQMFSEQRPYCKALNAELNITGWGGDEMIIIVENCSRSTDAFKLSLDREGIPSAGFSSEDFKDWVETVARDDVLAINAFILGECESVLDIASFIKRRSTAAVIAVKKEKTLATTLELFAKGVDDVVAAPCHVREMLARIEAISRRTRSERGQHSKGGSIYTFGDGRDPLVRGQPFQLPRRELRILEFLVANQSRRVTKAQIFNSVYGLFEHSIDENVVESHISKLRRRLRQSLGYDPIESKRHLGYRLVGSTVSEA